MIRLEDIKPGVPLTGLEAAVIGSVVAVVPIVEGTVQVLYKTPDGTLKERLINRADDGRGTYQRNHRRRPGQLPGMEGTSGSPKAESFHGNVTVNAATAKLRLVQIADEIIAVLAADPSAEVETQCRDSERISPTVPKDQTKQCGLREC